MSMSEAPNAALTFLGDKYEVVAKMGEGGMGTVYRVHHKLLGEDRVVKLMKGSAAIDPTARKRFLREARAAAQLRHPSIAQLYDFSVEADGKSYIIMEYIDGKDLAQVLDEHGAPSLELAIEILVQGLEAIQLLHSQGWVHRDIAPDNLMLTRDMQGAPSVKLIDLGIVKSIGGDSSVGGGTAVGSFVGKARYTAPEQFKEGGSENLKQPSDLYGFGVLAYELLTGACPIVGKTFSDVLSHQLFKPPLDFSESDPRGRVPAELRELILHALAKKPEERVESAGAFLDRLRPFRRQDGSTRERLAAELRGLLETVPADPADEDATVIIRREDVLAVSAQVQEPQKGAGPTEPREGAAAPEVSAAENSGGVHGDRGEVVSPPLAQAENRTTQRPKAELDAGQRPLWRRLLGLR